MQEFRAISPSAVSDISNLSAQINLLNVSRETFPSRQSPAHVTFGSGQRQLISQQRQEDAMIFNNQVCDLKEQVFSLLSKVESGEAKFQMVQLELDKECQKNFKLSQGLKDLKQNLHKTQDELESTKMVKDDLKIELDESNRSMSQSMHTLALAKEQHKAELYIIQQSINNLKLEKSELLQLNKEHKAEINLLRKQIYAIQSESNSLKMSVSDTTQRLASASSALNSNEKTKLENERENAELLKDLKVLKEQLHDKASSSLRLQLANDQLLQANLALQEELKAQKETSRQLMKEMDNLKIQNSQLQEQEQDQENHMKNCNAQLASALESLRIQQEEAKSCTLHAKKKSQVIDEKEQSIDRLKSQIERMQKDYRALMARNQISARELFDMIAENSDAKVDLKVSSGSSVAKLIQTLKTLLLETRTTKQNMQKQLNEAKEAASKLSRQNSIELEKLKACRANLRKAKADHSLEMDSLKSETQEMASTHEKLSSESRVLQKKLSKLMTWKSQQLAATLQLYRELGGDESLKEIAAEDLIFYARRLRKNLEGKTKLLGSMEEQRERSLRSTESQHTRRQKLDEQISASLRVQLDQMERQKSNLLCVAMLLSQLLASACMALQRHRMHNARFSLLHLGVSRINCALQDRGDAPASRRSLKCILLVVRAAVRFQRVQGPRLLGLMIDKDVKDELNSREKQRIFIAVAQEISTAVHEGTIVENHIVLGLSLGRIVQAANSANADLSVLEKSLTSELHSRVMSLIERLHRCETEKRDQKLVESGLHEFYRRRLENDQQEFVSRERFEQVNADLQECLRRERDSAISSSRVILEQRLACTKDDLVSVLTEQSKVTEFLHRLVSAPTAQAKRKLIFREKSQSELFTSILSAFRSIFTERK